MTFPGVESGEPIDETLSREPPKHTKRSSIDRRMQIPRRIHSQVSEEDAVFGVAKASWGGIPQVSNAKGEQDRGRASVERSCAYDDRDPTEIRGVAGDRIHQGQECDTLGTGLRREEAEFRRPAFLGSGVFCIHCRRDEEVIREYIRAQEKEDSRLEQMNLWR